MSPPSRSSSPTSRRSSSAVRVRDGWPPRWLTPVPATDVRRGDGDTYSSFIEAACRVTKDSVAAPAGQLLQLRSWQRKAAGHLYARRADGRLRHRQALIGLARKNGKSSWGAGLALADLVMGPQGGEVYSCAGDREQARIVFGTARRMVELDPELSEIVRCYRDVLEVKATGSIYRCLSAEAYTKEGLNPHRVFFDEVHVQPNRELWDVMALAQGARLEPLMVGITTAWVRTDATGRDSLCYQLYQYGCRIASGEVEDDSFFMAWWEPRNPQADHTLEATWKEANPGYNDLVSGEDFRSAVKKTPEAEFRTKRGNQWVATQSAWLPAGLWKARLGAERPPADLAEVVLGFDGSFNNDSTALVVVSIEDVPHVDVVQAWEKPVDSGQDWRVPILEVEDAIRAACRRWQVREIVCDPFRWARTYQVLEEEGLPVLEFPQSPQRMVPATQRFYEAVLNGGLTHSGNPQLARHLDNCVLRVDSRGSRINKESKGSPRRIDLAVASVMALDRAAYLSMEHEDEGGVNLW